MGQRFIHRAAMAVLADLWAATSPQDHLRLFLVLGSLGLL